MHIDNTPGGYVSIFSETLSTYASIERKKDEAEVVADLKARTVHADPKKTRAVCLP